MQFDLIVTRHGGLVEWLAAQGIVAQVVAHVSADDVRGKHVIGVLPLHLASLAASVTEVVLDLPAEMRGKELSKEQVELYQRGVTTYVVATAQVLERAFDLALYGPCDAVGTLLMAKSL